MGILSSLTGKQLADVIEWADMDDETLFYKWNNNEIKKGSRLIIRPAQDAIFLYQGRVEGVFTEEGDYDVESKIIPFLSTLKGFKFGFNSGLRAEVVFINTREFNIQWGTTNALNLPVASLPGGMPVRAYGLYTCKIADYGVLIDKVAGIRSTYTVDDIKTRVGAMNDQLLMKWIVSEGKDMFNIQANAFDISNGIKEDLNKQLSEIGIEVTSYSIQSVSYPESVKEMQEKAAGAAMVSDVNAYTQVQMANSFDKPGTGSSDAASMASMAMGMAMGQQMVNNLNSAANNQTAPQPMAAPSQVTADGVVPNFCPNCGTKTVGARFCPNCGTKLVED